MSGPDGDRVPRKAGRAYVVGMLLLAVVIVFGVLLGVSQCAPNDPDSGDQPGQGNAAVVELLAPAEDS